MTTYILTAKIKVGKEDIRKATKWAKRRGYNYGDDLANLIFDYLTDGGQDMDMESTEIEEI